MLDQQMEVVKKVQHEQENKERMLLERQAALARDQQELLAQKEQLVRMQIQASQRESHGVVNTAADLHTSPPKYVAADMREAYGPISVKKWEDGKVYKGEFLDGKRHGRGSISYPDGSTYDGEWLDDLRHGQGVYRYADGTQYQGNWVQGNRNGLGMCQYSDGNKYEGEWQNNLPHGAGSCKFAEGSVYKGEFQEGRMHGFGTLYAADGTPTFQVKHTHTQV